MTGISSVRRLRRVALAGAVVAVLASSMAVPAHGTAGAGDPATDAVAQPARLHPDEAAALRVAAAEEGRVRVLVRLDTAFAPEGTLGDAGIASQTSRIAAAQHRLVEALPTGAATVTVEPQRTPLLGLSVTARGLAALEAHPSVRSIHPERAHPPALAESVPFVGASALHEAGLTGEGALVAVLDSGTQADHPALGGRVVLEACFARGAGGVDDEGDCPDGSAAQTGPGAGEPFRDEIGDQLNPDQWQHGTHVAGIIAGEAVDLDDGTELADGMAPDADILGMQVFSVITEEEGEAPELLAHDGDLLLALEHVLDVAEAGEHDVVAANLSLGSGAFASPCTLHPLTEVIASLASRDVVTLIAAGNQGETAAMNAPGCVQGAVSVGATWMEGDAEAIAGYSNATDFTSVFVLGGAVSAVPEPGGGHGSRWVEGTSMATPHAAGAWALLQSATDERISVNRIRDALRETGVAIVDRREGADEAVYPSVRVDAALDHLEDAVMPTTLEGIVSDLFTGQRLADADLRLLDDDAEILAEAVTDAAGWYRMDLDDVPAARGELTVEARVGDDVETHEITVAATETTIRHFEFLDSFDDEPPCPEGDDRPVFTDVSERNPHAGSIACLALREVVRGLGDGTFGPDLPVRRDHLATFVAQTLDAAGIALPDGEDRFDDLDASVHATNVERLAAAGIIAGTGERTFSPGRVVNRAQTATFLAAAVRYAYDEDLAAEGADYFADTAGNPHVANIDFAYEWGLVRGVEEPSNEGPGRYDPDRTVRRDQMTSGLRGLLETIWWLEPDTAG